MPSAAAVFLDIVKAEGDKETSKMSAANLREVTQAMLTMVHAAKPKGSSDKITWDNGDELASAVVKLKESKPSTPLHKALDNLVKLVAHSDTKKSKKRKQSESAPSNDPVDPSTESQPKPKKKKKREKESSDI